MCHASTASSFPSPRSQSSTLSHHSVLIGEGLTDVIACYGHHGLGSVALCRIEQYQTYKHEFCLGPLQLTKDGEFDWSSQETGRAGRARPSLAFTLLPSKSLARPQAEVSGVGAYGLKVQTALNSCSASCSRAFKEPCQVLRTGTLTSHLRSLLKHRL